MGIGPFESFVFPGVYTQTLNEAPTATAAGDIRVPAFIGVADEESIVNNFEMIRGSSSLADNPIVKENVSSQLDGTNRSFRVSFYPIVRGDGNGTTTTNPNDITVYMGNEPIPVASVNGETGWVYLVSIPPSDAQIYVSYYFKKHDTAITGEDLSDQATGTNVTFKVDNVPIVQGDNGGITTTDPAKVHVFVGSGITLTEVTVSAVDGDSGIITLASAPASGQTVTVNYYTNTHQDTSDILPSPSVVSLDAVGLSPGVSNFVPDVDFVLDTSGNFSTINWGHSYKVVSGSHTIGSDYFDSSKITSVTLYDNRVFRREATGTADGTNKVFTLEAISKTGQGLGKDTDLPSLVTAYVGTSPTDASQAVVLKLDGSLKQITLSSAPAADSTVFVTQYTNILPDDTWTLTDATSGVTGTGEYTVSGSNSGIAMDVQWSLADTTVSDPDFGAENVTYPNGTGPGNRDTQVIPGYAVAETVYLNFDSSNMYHVTSTNVAGSGSAGDNTGYLEQTYVDSQTGFRVSVMQGSTVDYTSGDRIGYSVSPLFVTSTTPTRGIPGTRTTVSDTEDITVGDTGIISTYNKSGDEPRIGDFYYVTFSETKTVMETPLFFTTEKDALAYSGPLSITNKLGMAAHLAFLNGAQAVVLYQIPRTEGEEDAPDSAYIAGINSFDEPMVGGLRPALMQPMTTSTGVLAYLKTSNIIQAGIRYQNERMTYFGFPINTSPTIAQAYAKSMASERMIAVYPDGGVTSITDYLGNEVEYLVDGSFLGAAISGRDTSPAFDVATPLTRKPVVGFNRLYRRMDSVTSAQTANAGITLLEEQAAGIVIKIDLTTDLTSVLTRQPSVVRIKDFVQKGTRNALNGYVGQKFLVEKLGQIEKTLTSYMSALKQAQIIADFSGISAKPDPNDPTIVQVEAYYSPILPLLWIIVTFNLRSK